jgi:hypothetical protein
MDFLVSLESSAFAEWLQFSAFAYPMIESTHVLGVALLFGTLLIVDLRLVGIRLMSQSISSITHATLKWTWLGFALALVTGLMMFSERATHYITNFEFLSKMGLLGLAGANMLVFEFLTRRSLAAWDTGQPIPGKVKLAGYLSLAFWIGVIIFGRLIGFAEAHDPLASL